MSEALVHVNGPVWYFPTDGSDRIEPNVGVIAAAQGTVLVDAGNSPRHARRIATAIKAAGLPPVSHLILTHHHWDHVFGAQVFDAQIIAHQLCAESLAERANRPWSTPYLEEEALRNPLWEPVYRRMQNAVVDWDTFRMPTATITFTRNLTLHFDELTVRVEHVGGKHAPDSAVVLVPQAQAALVGDSYYASVQRPMIDKSIDDSVIQRLLDYEDITYYVDGHTARVMTRDDYASAMTPD